MLKQVEIFKTNVECEEDAGFVAASLAVRFPKLCINFDLQDCDHILRVESTGASIDPQCIIQYLNEQGYTCTQLT